MLYNCWPDISIAYRRIICTTLILHYLDEVSQLPNSVRFFNNFYINEVFGKNNSQRSDEMSTC
jgi:hypothetical protein